MPLPVDVEGIFDWATRLLRLVEEVSAIKAERKKQQRRDSYKLRKSLGLIKKRPTKADIAATKAQERKDLRDRDSRLQEYDNSCTCFSGHPPCWFCETHDPDEAPHDQ